MASSIVTSVKKDKLFWIALIFCVVVLGFGILFRLIFVDGLLIGSDSYYNLRMAKDPFASYDSLSFGGRDIVGERAWFALLYPAPVLLSWILPFLFGILSFILFYYLVSRINKNVRFYSSLILLVSPIFIYLFSTSTKYAAAVFFLLLSVYFLINRKHNFMVVSLILTSLFSVIIGFVALVCLLLYKKMFKILRWRILFSFILLLGITFIYYYKPILNGFSLFYPFEFNFAIVMTILFTDLGSVYGFGLFMIILSIFGIYYTYSEDYKYLLLVIAFAVLLVLSIYILPLMFLLNFVLAFFAGLGIVYFYNYEWKYDMIKTIVMIVLICGLLFSFLSYEEKFVSSYPTESVGKAMKSLTYEHGDITVVSSPENGNFISYSGAKNLVDDNYFYISDPEQRIKEINAFYHYTTVEDITKFMQKYNATYVWVDNNMQDKLWDSSESGLLYFFSYGERMFFEIYSGSDVHIWELINKEAFFNQSEN